MRVVATVPGQVQSGMVPLILHQLVVTNCWWVVMGNIIGGTSC